MSPALLPPLALALLVGAAWRPGMAAGSAVARGALIWAALAVLALETLGLAGAIGAPALTGFWLAVSAGAGWHCRSRPALPSWSWSLAAGGLILALVLVTALLAPPNTWDSMTYHMARVMHWQHQGSLAHYPTAIVRQLASNPLAEMLILHFQVLAGDDRFANLVQTLALGGSAAVAAAIAGHLGGDRRTAGLAAMLVLSLPMAILQGSSTQNDLATGFFLLAAAERLLAWRASGREVEGLDFAAALGLALLTKGTAYFFAAPLAAVAAWRLLAGFRRRPLLLGLAMAALVFGLNAGHWGRNLLGFGTPLGPQYGVAVEELGPGALASNLIRGTASNLASPSGALNQALVAAVEGVHRALGREASDPRVTFPYTRFELTRSVLDESLAGNPLHWLLMLAAAGLALLRRDRAALGYGGLVLAGGLLFCLALRWQPWITRLQLPFFLLAMPAVALALAPRLTGRRLDLAVAGLLLAALPWAVLNQARPLYGELLQGLAHHVSPDVWRSPRIDQVFAMRPGLAPAYRAAVAAVAGKTGDGVGLVLGGDDWEYPFWGLLAGTGDAAAAPVRIGHVCHPEAGPPPPADFAPRVLLVTRAPMPETLDCEAGLYRRQALFPAAEDANSPAGVAVYLR
jgi:hypothetical protein